MNTTVLIHPPAISASKAKSSMSGGTPTVSVASGGGTLNAVQSVDSSIPGAYRIRVRLGLGANVLHVVDGAASADITVQSP